MIRNKHTHERGAISGMQVTIAGLAILVLGLGSFGIWSFVSYQDAQSNVDNKIELAVTKGMNEQALVDEKKFSEREKEPNKIFKGPENYCGLSFNYPKTWSAYEENDVSNGGDFEAYLNPDVVKPVKEDQQFAIRVNILLKDYDDVVATYAGRVTKGDLKQSSAASQGNQGVRLDGNFSKNIRGAAVLYKCRDRTIVLRTDADTFKPDFDKIIQTINYNS